MDFHQSRSGDFSPQLVLCGTACLVSMMGNRAACLRVRTGIRLQLICVRCLQLPAWLTDEYFSHMVLDDLNLIIRDIRETHKKDSESAPQTTVANELKENLEAVENFKGSRLEKLAVLYCKQLGINYKNLSDEEFRWLIRILQKSKKTGTPINQRKKR